MFFLLTSLKHNFLEKYMAWDIFFSPWVVWGWEELIDPWCLLAFGFRDNESEELLRGNWRMEDAARSLYQINSKSKTNPGSISPPDIFSGLSNSSTSLAGW